MSPLSRPLLALAAAALLASACADDDLKARLLGSQGAPTGPAACSELQLGATPKNHEHIRKNQLKRFHVDPPKPNVKSFTFKMPNTAKTNEALVGQSVVVCDFRNPNNTIDVTPVVPLGRLPRYTPLRVTCEKGCPSGVEVIADQFVIKKLD